MPRLFKLIPLLVVLAFTSSLTADQLGGGAGLQRGLSTDRFKQLTQSSSSAYPTTDNVPRVFIRFDDARDDLVERAGVNGTDGTGIAYSAARRGMPFGLAINYKKNITPTAGFCSIAQLNALIAYGEARGSKIEILQHGNTDFAQGAGATPYAVGDSFKTIDRIRDELRVTNLEASFGKKVRGFVSPGDGGSASGTGGWVLSNYNAVRRVLKENGIEFMFVGDNPTYTPIPSNVPAVTFALEAASTASFDMVNAYTPGMIKDPYGFMEGMTFDLNTMAVERAVNGLGSSTSAWNIDTNTALVPSDNTPNRTYSSTVRWYISRRLGGRMGFGIALHDSVSSQSPLSGGPYTGSFSHDYLMELLLELHNAGYIKLVTPSEWVEYYLGKYAKGTDLIDNPSAIVPCAAVGDTVGIDAPFPMGWCVAADESADYETNDGMFVNDWASGVNANINQWYTSTTCGPAVTSMTDYVGGVATASIINFTFGNLSPGRYMFCFEHDNAGSQIDVYETWAIAKLKMNTPSVAGTGWRGFNQTAWVDTMIVVEGSDVRLPAAKLGNIATGEWTGPRLWFNLPDMPFNMLNNATANRYKYYGGTDKGFSATGGRNYYESPLYSMQISIINFSAAKYSMCSLIYMGDD